MSERRSQTQNLSAFSSRTTRAPSSLPVAAAEQGHSARLGVNVPILCSLSSKIKKKCPFKSCSCARKRGFSDFLQEAMMRYHSAGARHRAVTQMTPVTWRLQEMRGKKKRGFNGATFLHSSEVGPLLSRQLDLSTHDLQRDAVAVRRVRCLKHRKNANILTN